MALRRAAREPPWPEDELALGTVGQDEERDPVVAEVLHEHRLAELTDERFPLGHDVLEGVVLRDHTKVEVRVLVGFAPRAGPAEGTRRRFGRRPNKPRRNERPPGCGRVLVPLRSRWQLRRTGPSSLEEFSLLRRVKKNAAYPRVATTEPETADQVSDSTELEAPTGRYRS
jgi:hypothetical protein